MATAVHCLYCFETLAAELEGRKSMTLDEVEKSWKLYRQETETSASTAKKLSPALRRVNDADASASSLSTPSSGSSMSLDADTPATSITSLPTEDPPIITKSPLFVTWNEMSRATREYELRGCIGTFEAKRLEAGLSMFAIQSALHDTRFHPISKRELPSLECAVTLLTDFEDCDDEMDWELGTHGLRISFEDRGRHYGSTYLPDVATEQGWTKQETLTSLIRKAGWYDRGDKSRMKNLDLLVVRYQGKKKELPYSEFKHWRDWVDANGNA
ncbi:AMMECR1 domain-containing protein [Xylariaceae sp. FL0255]|nr:AMMECR1 domain-containing protein [Xylariaceae sp. FL0255]